MRHRLRRHRTTAAIRVKRHRQHQRLNRHLRLMLVILIIWRGDLVPHHILADIRVDERIVLPARLAVQRETEARRRSDECHGIQRLGVDRMPFAIVDECRVKLRNAALRHFAVSRLFAAARTAANIRLRNRKRTVCRGDIVVTRLCAVIERISKRILAFAHIRLRTSHIV